MSKDLTLDSLEFALVEVSWRYTKMIRRCQTLKEVVAIEEKLERLESSVKKLREELETQRVTLGIQIALREKEYE